MSSTPLDLLAAGLQVVVRERGLERACADASWLQNILADYSPQTPALNRVAAQAAREGVPGWLQRAAPGAVDDVVARAVNRLASAHAIDAGAAHDAVSAWARALGVVYSGTRPTSAPAQPAAQPQDRIQRRIENLLNDAETAESAQKWQDALEAYNDVLVLEPKHAEALALRGVVQRRLGAVVAPAAKPPTAARPAAAPGTPRPAAKPVVPVQAQRPAAQPKPIAPAAHAWRVSWMSQWGEDTFGRWATTSIAGVETRFRFCPPGRFIMGSPEDEYGHTSAEAPCHPVEILNGFWLSDAPVTQRLWEAVAGRNPSHFKGTELPVETVSWLSCESWLAKAVKASTQVSLRLPAEAEWEYACRAGTASPTYKGNCDAPVLRTIAWYADNSSRKTHSVRLKAPNPWGLFDMLGNVWEWCADDQRPYGPSSPIDPTGGVGLHRVTRGGSWRSNAYEVRSARRLVEVPHQAHNALGMRIIAY